MSSDLDVYQVACELIRQLGGEAPGQAATQAHELLIDGDAEGYAYWERIRMTTYEQLWSPTSASTAGPRSSRSSTARTRP